MAIKSLGWPAKFVFAYRRKTHGVKALVGRQNAGNNLLTRISSLYNGGGSWGSMVVFTAQCGGGWFAPRIRTIVEAIARKVLLIGVVLDQCGGLKS